MGRANTAARPESAVLDALLEHIGEHHAAEREFLDWLTGDVDVRASELAEAMIARAGRRHRPQIAELSYLNRARGGAGSGHIVGYFNPRRREGE